MPAKDQPFEMTSANDKELLIVVHAPPTPQNKAGALVDLTGCSAEWRLMTGRHGVIEVEKTTATGGIVIAADQVAHKGEMTVTLNQSDTADRDGIFWHECDVIDASGLRVTVCTGRVTITPRG